MKIGSLFSGIGGLELGLERAIPGAEVIWQVEQDEYARQVLAKHWPKARRYNDVREVGAHNLERVDVICGGFPCQDISIAGKQAGIKGERSGLWVHFARVIGELRPRYIVVENVSALLHRGMGRVLGDLAARGYDAVWDCIPAASVGAPPRRDRVFLVAYSHSGTIYAEQIQRRNSESAAKPSRNGKKRHVAHSNRKGKSQPQRPVLNIWERAIDGSRAWTPEPKVGRVAHGVPRRMDQIRALGNAVVPQVAEVVGRVIIELEGASHE